jgi:hypothetical protein
MGFPLVQIGSLDLFWMPNLAEALAPVADIRLDSTWASKSAPERIANRHNARHLQAALSLYKRCPVLQRQNLVYHYLCRRFDRWLLSRLDPNLDALYVLSGCGQRTVASVKKRGKPVVIESGSTHTDFQHKIVWKEYQRNGLRDPLFPESYRNGVRQEFLDADFIQIPSRFVKQTYLEEGIPEEKLLLAGYGVDVERFRLRTASDATDKFRVICPSEEKILHPVVAGHPENQLIPKVAQEPPAGAHGPHRRVAPAHIRVEKEQSLPQTRCDLGNQLNAEID